MQHQSILNPNFCALKHSWGCKTLSEGNTPGESLLQWVTMRLTVTGFNASSVKLEVCAQCYFLTFELFSCIQILAIT